MGDRVTQKCDPSTMMVSYGIGLVSYWVPTLYKYAEGFNAINFSLARGCYSFLLNQFLGVEPYFCTIENSVVQV